VVRQARFKMPRTYMEHAIAGNAVHEEVEVGRDELGFEFMLNALRLTEGFAPALFAERTGLTLNAISASLDAAEAKGLLYRDHKLIRPTALGLQFLNDLQAMFLPDTDRT
jgi:oxygen-independent coproporphyrinogen-3 oxidase